MRFIYIAILTLVFAIMHVSARASASRPASTVSTTSYSGYNGGYGGYRGTNIYVGGGYGGYGY